MHLAKRARGLTFALKDGLEGFSVRFQIAKGAVNIAPMAGDETPHGRGEAEVPHLAVLEHPHQAVRIVFENFLIRGKDPSFFCDKPIKFFSLFFPEREIRAEPSFGDCLLLDLESFHQ